MMIVVAAFSTFLVLSIAWIMMTSSVWFSLHILGWRGEARWVAIGPIFWSCRAIGRGARALHRALWDRIGGWVFVFYAAIFVLLVIVDYLYS